MDQWELMQSRNSVRSYRNQPIEAEKAAVLQREIDRINETDGLHIQLFLEEPEAFDANRPHYGSFRGCRNYLALVGPKESKEKIGYDGEKLVLLAQELGLNTCWVALTYHKGKVNIQKEKGEKLHIVIALGYGETQGTAHRSKPVEKVAELTEQTPEWFRKGAEAALLAPTAVNQQHFFLRQTGAHQVSAKAKPGPCSRIDLGIVKYHFELGANDPELTWI